MESLFFEVKSMDGGKTYKKSYHPQNVLYVIVNPSIRTVHIIANDWKKFWWFVNIIFIEIWRGSFSGSVGKVLASKVKHHVPTKTIFYWAHCASGVYLLCWHWKICLFLRRHLYLLALYSKRKLLSHFQLPFLFALPVFHRNFLLKNSLLWVLWSSLGAFDCLIYTFFNLAFNFQLNLCVDCSNHFFLFLIILYRFLSSCFQIEDYLFFINQIEVVL